jgi:molybdate transport system regulatory protein
MARRHRASVRAARLRGRVWVQVGGVVGLTEAGADLLAQIDALGSLSEAARRLRFSYRRAWVLLDGMNRSWPRPLVDTKIGGRRGGGAQLTEAGHAVLGAYRDLQVQLEHLLDQAGPAFHQAAGAAGLHMPASKAHADA